MPKKTRSAEVVDAVRREILNCAFDILVKNGYEGLFMAKVGSRMNMTAANLYNYYRNKDELLIAVHKKAFSMLYDRLQAAVQSTDSPLERYRRLAYAFVDFGTDNTNIYDTMFTRRRRQYKDYIGTPEEPVAYDEYRSSIRVLSLTIETIEAYRRTKPELKPADPKFLALQSTCALHGVISFRNSGLLAQISDDPQADLRTMIENIIANVTG